MQLPLKEFRGCVRDGRGVGEQQRSVLPTNGQMPLRGLHSRSSRRVDHTGAPRRHVRLAAAVSPPPAMPKYAQRCVHNAFLPHTQHTLFAFCFCVCPPHTACGWLSMEMTCAHTNRPHKPCLGDDCRSDFLQDSCSLTSTYSPEYVRQRALETPGSLFNVLVRVTDIAVSLGLFAGKLWTDRLTGQEDEPDIVKKRAAELRWAQVQSAKLNAPLMLVVPCCNEGSQVSSPFLACEDTLTYLGPSFIKAGQVLANRPDIVREDYMNELCCLQMACKYERVLASQLRSLIALAPGTLSGDERPKWHTSIINRMRSILPLQFSACLHTCLQVPESLTRMEEDGGCMLTCHRTTWPPSLC
eukprot:1160490-Pelagomonas_calceolata.AAC.7